MAEALTYVEGLCGVCGIEHTDEENHEYEYKGTVDEELNCHICLSPILDPMDTKCGHSFCKRCITQTVNSIKMCPLDRKPTSVEELRDSNFSFKRLLDKLKVICPNCSAGMERGQLQGHLSGRCRSKRVKCTFGACPWSGPEREYQDHAESCEFGLKSASIKFGGQTTIELDLRDDEPLGMAIVGGNETPLIAIMVQEIFPSGAIRRDKRLKTGDVILKINDLDVQDIQHIKAKKALSSAKGTLKLKIHREQKEENQDQQDQDIFKLSITKNRGVPLGITLAGKKKQPGVYIVTVAPDSIAARDRRMRPHDRILEVNGRRVNQLPASRVSDMFKQNNRQINLVVSRDKTLARKNSVRDFQTEVVPAEPIYQPLRMSVIPRARAQKTITIQKTSTSEKLGMSLAGGKGPKVNVPLYISKISADGCVARSGQLNIGDIVLSVNGKKLFGLSHDESLERTIKATKDTRQVVFKVIESDDIDSNSSNYHPSWLKWLALPALIDNSKIVVLKKPKNGSFGIVITGGSDSSHGPQPIFIQTLVYGGVGHRSKLLKCGDVITKVNDQSLSKLTHQEALQILRGVKEKAEFSIKSWPGTVL